MNKELAKKIAMTFGVFALALAADIITKRLVETHIGLHERIDVEVPAFATYLEVSGEMIRAQGAELYVGQALRDLGTIDGLDLVESTTATISPTVDEVARLFAMNLATWRHDPWIVEHVDPQVVATLADDLDARSGDERRGEIVWTDRQLVLERVGAG